MKSTFLHALIFVALVTKSFCQAPINVCEDCNNLIHTFDFNLPNDSTLFFFSFDSLLVDNIWQIGHPEKTMFTYGYSGPKALVTDTLNPYPPNNLSTFQFSVKNCSFETSGGCGAYEVCYINVAFKMNSDSLTDGGTIEVSHNGSPFINIIEDTLASIGGDIYSIADTVSSLNKPGFSGTSNHWQEFGIYYERLMQGFDTIILKFTFSSDSIQTDKDGWMIGMVQTGGIFEGIPEVFEKSMIKISPNPCSEYIKLEISNKFEGGELIIYSGAGQVIRKIFNVVNNETINISNFHNGIYFIQYGKDRHYGFEKFIKRIN